MLTAMGDVMREAYKRGWITTRDGNVSVRIRNNLYITPSAVRKYTIQVENIVKMPISSTGDLYNQEGASIELEMHRLVQLQKSVKSVVHLHPTFTIAAMNAGLDLQELANEFIELGRYTNVGKTVPRLASGSKDLAEMTAIALLNADIVGQKSHGVTAKGANPWEAFEHIERLEHICKIAVVSASVNKNY